MHRSGSTLVWQIARHLMADQPGLRNPRGLSTSEFPAAAANSDDLLMAKVHFRPAMEKDDFPQVGAKYLYTYRDIRDVIASLYRKGRAKPGDPERGARNSRLGARREMRGDAFWRSRDDVWIRKYEDFRDDVPGLVRDLAAYLEVSISPERVAEIVADVDLEAQQQRAIVAKQHGVDDDLRVTSNHITDGRAGAWRDTLTPEELSAIEGETARWLVEHGYEVETNVGLRKTVDLRPGAEIEDEVEVVAATPTLDAAQVAALVRPYAVATGVTLVAGALSHRRNPGVSGLLWLAGMGAIAAGSYQLGRHQIPPRKALGSLVPRVIREKLSKTAAA